MAAWLNIILVPPTNCSGTMPAFDLTDDEEAVPANDYQNQSRIRPKNCFILISEDSPCRRSRCCISKRQAQPDFASSAQRPGIGKGRRGGRGETNPAPATLLPSTGSSGRYSSFVTVTHGYQILLVLVITSARSRCTCALALPWRCLGYARTTG